MISQEKLATEQRITLKTTGHALIDEWNNDWETLNIGEVLRLWNVAAATVSSAKKEALTEQIKSRIGHYLERRMTEWHEEVLEHLEPDMEEMSTVLGEEVERFAVDLNEIRASIVDEEMPELLDVQKQRVRKTIQMLYGVMALDPNQITGSLMSGSWTEFIGRIMSQVIAVSIALTVGTFFAGPAGWITALSVVLIELILVHKVGRHLMLNRVRDRIGSELRAKLVEAAPEIKSEIQQLIASQFETRSDSLRRGMEQEIKEVTAQLENVLATKREDEAAINAEKSRLDAIEENLDGLFKQISHETYGTWAHR